MRSGVTPAAEISSIAPANAALTAAVPSVGGARPITSVSVALGATWAPDVSRTSRVTTTA